MHLNVIFVFLFSGYSFTRLEASETSPWSEAGKGEWTEESPSTDRKDESAAGKGHRRGQAEDGAKTS